MRYYAVSSFLMVLFLFLLVAALAYPDSTVGEELKMFAQDWIWGYLAVVLTVWLPITYWCVKKGREQQQARKTKLTSAVAPSRYNFQVEIAGQTVVVRNVEKNEENVSITGTVGNRQAAAVRKRRRFRPDLTPQQRWEQYAWELLEADRKRR